MQRFKWTGYRLRKSNLTREVQERHFNLSKSWFISDSDTFSEEGDKFEKEEMLKKQVCLKKPDCKDDKFIQVLAYFRIANPEDLFLLAMKGSKKKFCRDLTVGTDKVTQYMKHCTITPSQELYIKLLSGLGVLKQKLCDDNDFEKLFKGQTECYNMVQYEVEACWGPQDWLEMTNTTEICNTMKTVLGCHYMKTLFNCGLIAAEIFNDLMKAVMSSVSDVQCPIISQKNYFRDLRSSSESCSTVLEPLSLLMILSYAILVMR